MLIWIEGTVQEKYLKNHKKEYLLNKKLFQEARQSWQDTGSMSVYYVRSHKSNFILLPTDPTSYTESQKEHAVFISSHNIFVEYDSEYRKINRWLCLHTAIYVFFFLLSQGKHLKTRRHTLCIVHSSAASKLLKVTNFINTSIRIIFSHTWSMRYYKDVKMCTNHGTDYNE